ncbi:MAG: LacI family transcriptional regulator [Propionibacteriaceae bacterium]|jgi:LacI family transcriptional regulator|nr:LacI family transcriptional regulator [Propionibacteriaceae bacterium]
MTRTKSGAPTIYDVASAAGVSPSTVSRAFSRPSRVAPATAERIRAAAAEVGYQGKGASPAARARTATRLIGITIADLSNPFYAQLVHGAQIAVAHAGYELVLADFRESSQREKAELERLLDIVDGLVIASSRMTDAGLRLVAQHIPAVVVSRVLPGLPSIVPDNAYGVEAAVSMLHDWGHTSITYVAGPEASWADQMRYRAIRDASARAGHSVQRIGPFLPTFEDGMAASRQLIDHPPTAIIAHNDMEAIGVMHGLMAAGIRIPEDVSVVGVDDILAARLVTPRLTTIAVPGRQLGMAAVRNLIGVIDGGTMRTDAPIVMPVQLKIRESAGPRRRRDTLR